MRKDAELAIFVQSCVQLRIGFNPPPTHPLAENGKMEKEGIHMKKELRDKKNYAISDKA